MVKYANGTRVPALQKKGKKKGKKEFYLAIKVQPNRVNVLMRQIYSSWITMHDEIPKLIIKR